jgi:hypothetical protein
MSDEPFVVPENPEPPPPRRLGPFIGLCLGVAAVSVLYRIIVLGQKEQTALMFIGLPTAMAILLTFLPRAKSATGMIMKGISLFLLIMGILFIEGFICILMAAPFFYSIGFIVGIFADKARARREFDKRFKVLVLPALILMSLEGLTGALSFPRDEAVTVSRDVALAPAAAREQLARGPWFVWTQLPLYLKIGFPYPQEIQGTGLEVNDTWKIRFAGGEGKPGDLLARVVESDADHLLVERVSDGSHISHWLDWREAEWKIEPHENGSKVTLTMRYRRLLDPAWYFKPLERYGVRKAGEYFLHQTFRST